MDGERLGLLVGLPVGRVDGEVVGEPEGPLLGEVLGDCRNERQEGLRNRKNIDVVHANDISIV